jgi:hypothetical protein
VVLLATRFIAFPMSAVATTNMTARSTMSATLIALFFLLVIARRDSITLATLRKTASRGQELLRSFLIEFRSNSNPHRVTGLD